MGSLVQEHIFRDFNFHKVGRDVVAMQYFFHVFRVTGIAQLAAGVVDGYRAQGIAKASPDCHLPDGKLCGDASDAPDPAILFRDRNKLGRSDIGIFYPDQGFISRNFLGFSVHFGLVQHVQFIVLNGVQQGFADGMFPAGLFLQFIGVYVNLVSAALAGRVHGVFRIGDQMFRFVGTVRQGDAHAGAQFHVNASQYDGFGKCFLDFPDDRVIQ